MTAADRLAESKRLVESATPGPWRGYLPEDSTGYTYVDGPDSNFGQVATCYIKEAAIGNAGFIAHARTALPRYVQALEAVLAVVEPIIERTKDQIGTHSPNCHEYHVSCLAVAVRARIESALGGSDE